MNRFIEKIVAYTNDETIDRQTGIRYIEVHYTSIDLNGNVKKWIQRINGHDASINMIDYFKSKTKQSENELKKDGRIVYLDYHQTFDKKEVPKHELMGQMYYDNKSVKKDCNSSKKKMFIRITSLATAAVLAVISQNYHVKRFFTSSERKAKIAVEKLENNGYSSLSDNDLMDISRYVEEENNDNFYQIEERRLNDQVLRNLVSNPLQLRVINRAQGLFMDCFNQNNSHSYNQDAIHRYFMYMSSLFKGGDYLNYADFRNINVAAAMKDNYAKDKSVFDAIYSNTYRRIYGTNQNVGPTEMMKRSGFVNRMMYSAVPDDALVFNQLPTIAKKILMEQFVTICQNADIKIKNEYERPSWWVELHHTYDVKELVEEMELMCERYRDELESARENARKM